MRAAALLGIALTAASIAPAPSRAQTDAADSTRMEAGLAAVSTAAAIRPLSPGDTVRLRLSAGRYAGTLREVTPETFTLAAPGRLDALPRADVAEMHRLVSRESRRSSIVRGAGLGLVAGAALGFLGGAAAGKIDCAPEDSGCTPGGHDPAAKAVYAIDGAAVGALLGAMLGPTFRRARWERVDPSPSPRAEPLPAPPTAAPAPAPR